MVIVGLFMLVSITCASTDTSILCLFLTILSAYQSACTCYECWLVVTNLHLQITTIHLHYNMLACFTNCNRYSLWCVVSVFSYLCNPTLSLYIHVIYLLSLGAELSIKNGWCDRRCWPASSWYFSPLVRYISDSCILCYSTIYRSLGKYSIIMIVVIIDSFLSPL